MEKFLLHYRKKDKMSNFFISYSMIFACDNLCNICCQFKEVKNFISIHISHELVLIEKY